MIPNDASLMMGAGYACIETASGRFLQADARCCSLLGYARQDLARIDYRSLIPAEDQPGAQSDLCRLLAGEIPELSREERLRHAAGHYVRVRWTVPRTWPPGQPPPSYLALIEDPGAVEQVEALRRQRSRDLSHVLEFSRTLAITLDLGTMLQAAADGASRLLGMGSAAIYLQDGDWLDLMATNPPLPPGMPDAYRRSALADHPRIREAIDTARPVLLSDAMAADLLPAEAAIIRDRGLRTLLFLPLVAGERVLGTLIVGSVGVPMPVAAVQVDQACTLANLAALAVVNARLYEAVQRHVADLEREVAERKRAEAALRLSEEKFAKAFHTSPDAININRLADGTYVAVNRSFAAITGYSEAEVLGKTSSELSIWNSREDRERLVAELRDKGEVANLEAIFRLKDGTVRTGLMSATLIEIDGERHILSITRDITARRLAEEERARLQVQLTQAQKMESVGRLAGGVAHDFNNMLGVILGHAELALEQLPPDGALYSDLEEIRKAAQRSADLTRQLLAFARKQAIAPRVLDLNATIESMVKMLRRLIGEDVDLAWLPAADLWRVRLDPGQVDQILANLCVNARDAIAGVGKVTLETGNVVFDEDYCAQHVGFTPGEFVMIAVSDNGCGMDSETMSRLFEPFFTTKNLGQGTGLGLATVYGVVKQNHGLINVYSEPGVGTTFRIYLPREATGEPEPEARGSSEAAGGTETVLVVEDEPAILDLVKRVLEKLGFVVLAARSPEEALGLAGDHPGRIDLLLSDVIMPGMNGRDLAGALRATRPSIRQLFMSGYTANVIAHHGVLDAGVHFLQKPFAPNDLVTKVRRALAD